MRCLSGLSCRGSRSCLRATRGASSLKARYVSAFSGGRLLWRRDFVSSCHDLRDQQRRPSASHRHDIQDKDVTCPASLWRLCCYDAECTKALITLQQMRNRTRKCSQMPYATFQPSRRHTIGLYKAYDEVIKPAFETLHYLMPRRATISVCKRL